MRLKFLLTLVLSVIFLSPVPSFAGGKKHGGSCGECRLACPIVALDKAKDLGLDKKQTAKVSKIKKKALSTGNSLMAKIKKLDEALVTDVVSGKLSKAQIEPRVLEISKIQGQLRAARLGVHIDLMEVLTKEQIEKLHNSTCKRKNTKMSSKECASETTCDVKKDDSKKHSH